jgi:hypothetical protein
LLGQQREAMTVKIEHAVAAGGAIGQVGFNALIVASLIIAALITNALIVQVLIFIALIIANLTIDAPMLVTFGLIRSRTGSSIPVVFNLSTAQMLRLFSHWSHISLI